MVEWVTDEQFVLIFVKFRLKYWQIGIINLMAENGTTNASDIKDNKCNETSHNQDKFHSPRQQQQILLNRRRQKLKRKNEGETSDIVKKVSISEVPTSVPDSTPKELRKKAAEVLVREAKMFVNYLIREKEIHLQL